MGRGPHWPSSRNAQWGRRRKLWQTGEKKFDPITLEILWRRLISIVDEADSTVARTAFSSLLRDAHDYTCMFTDRKGRELAQGTFATPGQSGAMALGHQEPGEPAPQGQLQARRRVHHQRPLGAGRAPERRVRDEPDLPPGKTGRLHRLRLPPLRHRRPRLLGQPRGVRGRSLHPAGQALRRRGAQRGRPGHDPLERAHARRGDRRHPLADRRQPRLRGEGLPDAGGLRPGEPRRSGRRDHRPHRREHAGGHRKGPGRHLSRRKGSSSR